LYDILEVLLKFKIHTHLRS